MRDYFFITGKSKKVYKFLIYDIENFEKDINLKNKGGIYIFGEKVFPNNIKKIYCGKTHDFLERFENHHKMDEIIKHHPNILGILFDENEKNRSLIELDILEGNNFTCNTQHN